MHRRFTVAALVLAGLGVLLGMTVVGSDLAQATGLAQTVTVVNTAANPVPIVDDHTNITVHAQATSSGNDCLNLDIYTVPAGKQFVAQFVSVNDPTGTTTTTADQAILYNASQGEFNDFVSLALTRGTLARWVASQTIDVVFPSGANLAFQTQADATTQCAALVTVGGHLEPAA
jgi:hypothetical protein